LSAINDAVRTPILEGRHSALRHAIRLAVLAAAILDLTVAASYWSSRPALLETIRWVGATLIVLCILGRTWSALYIGGIKNKSLVTQGPYSLCRNPLYLSSIVGAVGVGAQFGSLTSALLIGLVAWANYFWRANNEEARLLELFGEDYRRYLVRVSRFLPNFKRWQSPATIQIRPRAVFQTFTDSLFLLIAIPVCGVFDHLHAIGVLKSYFSIP
jgi:protein-S-isoprenylcysteine O-methyltransferase Ste14